MPANKREGVSGECLGLRHASVLDHLVFVIHIRPDAAVLIRVRQYPARRMFKVARYSTAATRHLFWLRSSAKPLR